MEIALWVMAGVLLWIGFQVRDIDQEDTEESCAGKR
jgi:hypothetical protein